MIVYVVHYISMLTGRMEVGNVYETRNAAWEELEKNYDNKGEVVPREICPVF